MAFIKCKNETEKLNAIRKYCEMQIENNDYEINSFEADRDSPLDYADEIHELKLRNKRFKTILEIIEADEFTSIMIL